MGLVRLLLAVSVVIAHSVPTLGLSMIGGKLAVEAFFVISGFYMSLILDKKYADDRTGNWLFYSNRFLRIYPMYWLVLSITVLMYALELLLTSHPFTLGVIAFWRSHIHYIDLSKALYLTLSNLFIIGLDIGSFLRLDTDHIQFTGNYFTHPPYVFQFIFIPQAWTLAIEVTVYAISPFLFRLSTWKLLALIVTSVALRAYAFDHGLTKDPWIDRFLPFEICFFLAGSLMYRIYKNSDHVKRINVGSLCLVLTVSMIIGFQFIPNPGGTDFGFQNKELIFFGPFITCIPAIFALSKNWKLDKRLGELSYPVYLCHLIIVPMCYGDFGWMGVKPIIGSAALAIIITRLVDVPLERYRQARVAEQHTTSS